MLHGVLFPGERVTLGSVRVNQCTFSVRVNGDDLATISTQSGCRDIAATIHAASPTCQYQLVERF
jgi:hypothetical protein